MGSKVRLAAPIQSDSIVDGEGIRAVIWFQGCAHNCEGCHNPESHDFNAGELVEISEVEKQIDTLEFQQGVTFSGGDPLYQPEAAYELAKYCQSKGLNVWLYTGFLYEDILKMAKQNSIYLSLLKEIDVLVDGEFVLAKKNFSVAFRGSSNQRIIDVKESLKKKKTILIEKYKYIEEK